MFTRLKQLLSITLVAIMSLAFWRANLLNLLSRGTNNSRSITTMADQVTVSYVTTPSKEVARNLARSLVERRLAACVNIVDSVESIYEWEEKVNQDKECLMIVKSSKDKTHELIKFVEQNHPYDCPEVITMGLDSGSEKYIDWVRKSTAKPPFVSDETNNK